MTAFVAADHVERASIIANQSHSRLGVKLSRPGVKHTRLLKLQTRPSGGIKLWEFHWHRWILLTILHILNPSPQNLNNVPFLSFVLIFLWLWQPHPFSVPDCSNGTRRIHHRFGSPAFPPLAQAANIKPEFLPDKTPMLHLKVRDFKTRGSGQRGREFANVVDKQPTG